MVAVYVNYRRPFESQPAGALLINYEIGQTMHTIVELANAARRAKTTVMDTLRAEGIEFIEKIGSQGGRPLKLYKITIEEFIKLQEARTPGKNPRPKVEQQQVSGINDLLMAKWSK